MEIKKCNTSIIDCISHFITSLLAFSAMALIIKSLHFKIGKNQNGSKKYHLHFIYISIYDKYNSF